MKHKLTRLTSLLLALIMSFSMLLVPAYASEFADVPANAWYEEAVDYVQENGWMKGVSANSFAPNAEVTRAMFVTVLARYAEANVNDEQTTKFDDVPSGTWYTGAVAWAVEKEIVKGVSENAFAPNRAISRQELCTMLARFTQKEGITLTEKEAAAFADEASIAGYAKDAVAYCARTGLVAGYTDHTFRPTATASRAQTAMILMRLDKLINGEGEDPVPMPAQSFNGEAGEGMNVIVDAPEGALPENTKMTTSRVTDEADLNNIASQINGNVLAAADITFKKDDAKIEPQKNVVVTISLAELDPNANISVVHVKDDGTVEPVDSELVSLTRRGNKAIQFSAKNFSVYAIIDGDEPGDDKPYRATYEFYNADGTPYEFKDIAGTTLTSQILKDGEILEDVGIPTKGASQNAKFVGWFVVPSADSNAYGEKVEVGKEKSVTENVTIKLKAKMQGIVNVFFVTAVMKDDQGHDMARSIVTVKQVEFTVGQTDPITVNTSDVTTDAPSNEQAVVGWNRDETAANAGAVEGTNGVITLYANGNANSIIDVMLFPAIQNAYWLYFDENDGGTGGGASYTKPQFVQIGGKPTEPEDPHRTGYTFGGWYKDAACTQAFDFNAVMTATTTVYAKWEGAQTTYTIIVKVQSTSDAAKLTSGANLSHDNKTYDFYKAFTIPANTGESATVSDSYKQLAVNGTELYKENYGHVKYETCDDSKTVEADGSTVLYVYYQRDVMTIHFKQNQNSSSDLYTWYGLYDASFTEAGKVWPVISGKEWTSSALSYTFLDAFKNFDGDTSLTTLTVWQQNQNNSNTAIRFYKETLTDDEYTLTFNSYFPDDSNSYYYSSFKLSEKYTGFSLYKYSRNGTTWQDATTSTVLYRNGGPAYVRYSRNDYDIEYHNGTPGTEGTIIRTDSVKYEAPLASHSNPTVTYPIAADADHYEFIGWFADSGWKTMVTFTELSDEQKANYRNWYGVVEFVVISKMPSHNFPLYAGYALKGWDCALDTNGGEFTSATQAGVFWLNYGETFSSDLKTNIKREGYVFQGWMLANVEGALNTKTENGLRFVDDNSNWTATDTPWEFSTGIEGPTYLQAKWFYKTSMSVVYDSNGGTEAPKDNGAYSDHATTVAFRAPVPPENMFFLGWDIQGTNDVEKLQPGATFEVSSEYAVDGVVTLKAVYNSTGTEEEVRATHIDWYANNKTTGQYPVRDDKTFLPVEPAQNVEQPTHSTDFPLQLNKGVDIHSATEFTNYGYKFLGWAKLHKENGTYYDHKNVAVTAAPEDENMDYALGVSNLFLKWEDSKFWVEYEGEWVETSQVAADEFTPYDDMFAVWEYSAFYVLHSSTGKLEMVSLKDCVDGKFDLTSKVAENHLYGGYYMSFGGVTAENVEAAKQPTKSATNHQVMVNGAVSYDGTATKTSDGVKFWDKNKAWKNGATNGELEYPGTGTSMKPVKNEVYYLKEVPNTFLQPKIAWTYDKNNSNKILDVFEITAVDDSNYNKIGFRNKEGKDEEGAYELTADGITLREAIAKALVLVQGDIDQVTIGTAECGAPGGYVAFKCLHRAANNTDYITGDTMTTVLPTWETYDNVVVSNYAVHYDVNEDANAITVSTFPAPLYDGTTSLYIDFSKPTIGTNNDKWLYYENGWTYTVIRLMDKTSKPEKVVDLIVTTDYDAQFGSVVLPRGNWDTFVLARRAPGSAWPVDNPFDQNNGCWGQSEDITLPTDKNLLSNFPVQYGTQTTEWGTYTPPEENP